MKYRPNRKPPAPGQISPQPSTPNNGTTNVKPPIAMKRNSGKRPQLPPPNPPPDAVYAKPNLRPKPQVRRKTLENEAPTAHPRSSTTDEGNLPMPDAPPPPLPGHLDESVFAPLSSELNTNNNNRTSSVQHDSSHGFHNQAVEEDEEDYMTSF